jgi:hypothetical protein
MVPEESDLSILVRAINDCQSLMREAKVSEVPLVTERAEPLPSLLEQCARLTDQLPGAQEPIRTIHHFACTGGTLISKCLACMPNTQLLSEVEPFSDLPGDRQRIFNPTDLIRQIRHGSLGADSRLEAEVFLSGLQALYTDCRRKGLRLVLRDHTHSHYCVGERVATTPTLRRLVESIAPVRAIVTVRHPLDSFLSMEKLGWLHFRPATLDEYCERYQRFLDDYDGIPLFRYEDLVDSPAAALQRMCEELALPFADGFGQLFSAQRLSGDSGRAADRILPRHRRPVSRALKVAIEESVRYRTVCDRLGYPKAGKNGR